MTKRRIFFISRFSRAILGELAGATLVTLMFGITEPDMFQLTNRIVLFILSSILYIYFDEKLYESE